MPQPTPVLARPAIREVTTPPEPRRLDLRGFRALLMRVHFYAGIFVAPFIVVAALTGLAYTVVPQLDDIAYSGQLHVAEVGENRLPVSQQVAAAQAAAPGLTVSSVLLPDDANDTTRVVFADPHLSDDRERTVFVDPYTGRVTGELVTWFDSTPLTTWLDDLHRNLHAGDAGRHYSEIAASWLGILALSGLFLWMRRRRTARQLLLPRTDGGGRGKARSWHATVGIWALIGLLFLSVTGLTWSRYAGGNFHEALTQLKASSPELNTALPADRAHGEPTMAAIDSVVAGARRAGLDGPIKVSVPATATTAWTVSQTDRAWPVRRDKVATDSAGNVTARSDFKDWPLLAKLSTLGVAGHMGILFGTVNQIVLAAVMIAVLCMVFWGYRMWWLRRPTKAGQPALSPPGAARRPSAAAVLLLGGVAIVLGVAMPLFGVTLLAFLVIDAVRPRSFRPVHRRHDDLDG